jgi:hypothetical protein
MLCSHHATKKSDVTDVGSARDAHLHIKTCLSHTRKRDVLLQRLLPEQITGLFSVGNNANSSFNDKDKSPL